VVTGNENRANTLNVMYINCTLDSEQCPIYLKYTSLTILTKLQSTKLKLTAHQFILHGLLTFFFQLYKVGYVHINVTLGHNHCCHGKALSIKYSECLFVAIVIQHAKQMCCIILSSVASLVVL